MSKTRILVVDDNKIVTTKLGHVLTQLGFKVTVKNNPIEALRWMQIPGNYPDMIISDVSMPEMSGYEFISRVRSDPAIAHVPVIMLTSKSTGMDDKVKGYEVGADDYLDKSITPTELELRIKALLNRTQTLSNDPVRSEATIITVFSLRGGVGTTSLAVNLSIALAQLWKIKVPLLDLALKSGHCALMLDLYPRQTITTLINWEDSMIDTETIEELLLEHKTGVKLLPAPHSAVEAELISVDTVDWVWPYLRATHPFIVIDGGSQLTEPILTIFERSHYILLMLAPDLGSLKATIDAVEVFKKLGYDTTKVLPIINSTFSHNRLSQDMIENRLNQPTEFIPYDHQAFSRGINTGNPVIINSPKSIVSSMIAALAYKLSSEVMVDQEIDNSLPYLKEVRKLAQAA